MALTFRSSVIVAAALLVTGCTTKKTEAPDLSGPSELATSITTEPLAFASFDRWEGTVAELLDTVFDPTLCDDDLAWVREHWLGQLVVRVGIVAGRCDGCGHGGDLRG